MATRPPTATPGDVDAPPAPVFVDPTGKRGRSVSLVARAVIALLVLYLAGFGFELARSPWVRGVGLPGLTRHPVVAHISSPNAVTTPYPANLHVATGRPSGTSDAGSSGTSSGQAGTTVSTSSAGSTTPGGTAPGATTATTRPTTSTTTATSSTRPGVQPTTPSTARGRKP